MQPEPLVIRLSFGSHDLFYFNFLDSIVISTCPPINYNVVWTFSNSTIVWQLSFHVSTSLRGPHDLHYFHLLDSIVISICRLLIIMQPGPLVIRLSFGSHDLFYFNFLDSIVVSTCPPINYNVAGIFSNSTIFGHLCFPVTKSLSRPHDLFFTLISSIVQ